MNGPSSGSGIPAAPAEPRKAAGRRFNRFGGPLGLIFGLLPPIVVTPEPNPAAAPAPAAASHSIAQLAGGDSLAVWVVPEASIGTLVARFATGPHAREAPYPVARDADPAVRPAIAPLLDGGAVVAYRASGGGGPALALVRLHGRRWVKSARLPAAPGSLCLQADGGRVAAAWDERTAAGARFPVAPEARIRAVLSLDAGARFLQPVTVAEGPDLSSPSLVLLHDAAAVLAWREGPRVELLRLSPEWYPDPPAALPLGSAAAGPAILRLRRDFAGESAEAEAELTVPTSAGPRGFRVIIPEAELLAAAADACHCAPSAGELRGYSIRGTVVRFDPDVGELTLDADAVPGVLDPGVHTFRLAPGERPQLRAGGDCLGRISREGATWTIFNLRRLGF